jgi:hypothetical protein
MLAQHLARVGGAEQPAPLQQRDHLGAEHVEHRRQDRRHDVEAVGGAIAEPVLDQIGDLLRRAGGGEMAARAGEAGRQRATPAMAAGVSDRLWSLLAIPRPHIVSDAAFWVNAHGVRVK